MAISHRKKERFPRRRRLEPIDDRAATGLFQPSENPNPESRWPKKARRTKAVVDELHRQLQAQEVTGYEGQVERPGDASPRDRYEGPDVGKRPHHPSAVSYRRHLER